MSRHEDLVRVNDMLKYAREAIELLGDANRDELGRNRVMQLALTRLVEIVGEAANCVSLASQNAPPGAATAFSSVHSVNSVRKRGTWIPAKYMRE